MPTSATAAEPTEAPKIKATDAVVFELWTRAGGRCEFHGCNAYLLEDELTTNEVRLSNIAHIVARSKGGPRGNDPMPIAERNQISNLMLLCTKCHAVIDKVDQYPKDLLLKYKHEHESRIRYLTGLGVEHETVVLRIMGNIRGDAVSISNEEVRTAVLDAGRYPRYLGDDRAIEIDLQSLPQEVDGSYWTAAVAKVNEVVERQISPAIERRQVGHLSVFPLARIPVLVHLGNALGDKIASDFYQHHRDEPAGWRWRSEDPVQFECKQIQQGTDREKVALLLSLSGKIGTDTLPNSIDAEFTIYEIAPVDREPGRSIVTTKETLHAFQRTYQSALRAIENEHGAKSKLHLFAAVPAPVAVICGRELLKDVSPQLHVYDRIEEGYELALTIN
ncbi:MAG TPA: SAVED domain-containing protein [Candidatus Paceibacterota bacterium]